MADSYPVMDNIFERKAQARLERARMPFGQKILILEKMRQEVLPIREAMHRARKQSEDCTTKDSLSPGDR